MTFLRNTLTTLLSGFGITLLGLLTGILQARMLGPTGRGLITTVLIWPQILVWAGGFSLGIANIHFGAADSRDRSSLFANSFWAALILGLLVGVPAIFLLPKFIVLTESQRVLLTISLIMMPIGLWSDFGNALLQSTSRFDRLAMLRLSAPVTVVLGLLGLWLTHHLTVTSAILTTWAGGWVQIGLTLSFLWRDGYVSIRPNFRLFRRCFCFSIRAHLGNLAGMANSRLDQLMMTSLVSPKALGLYAFAVALSEILRQLSNAIATVLFPKVSGDMSHELRYSISVKTVRWTIFISILGGGLLYMVAPWIVGLLWGSRFAEAIPTVRVLLPGTVALCVSSVLGTNVYGMGKTGVSTMAELISLAVMLPLIWILLPRWGIFGVGVASTCGYITNCLVVVIYFTRVFDEGRLGDFKPTHDDWHDFCGIVRTLKIHLRRSQVSETL